MSPASDNVLKGVFIVFGVLEYFNAVMNLMDPVACVNNFSKFKPFARAKS
jgi:hypothetical protein